LRQPRKDSVERCNISQRWHPVNDGRSVGNCASLAESMVCRAIGGNICARCLEVFRSGVCVYGILIPIAAYTVHPHRGRKTACCAGVPLDGQTGFSFPSSALVGRYTYALVMVIVPFLSGCTIYTRKLAQLRLEYSGEALSTLSRELSQGGAFPLDHCGV